MSPATNPRQPAQSTADRASVAGTRHGGRVTAKQTPVDYAEQVLDVHHVYDEASGAFEDLDAALIAYTAAAQELRSLNSRIEEREYQLAEMARVERPDISQAALDRLVKDSRHDDQPLRAIYADQRRAHDEQALADADIQRSKYRLRVLTARMNQLGGLLTFYAAAKATALPQPKKQTDEEGSR
jgi:hypothetical protein